MVTFDSPVLLCDVCGEVVLRDTTWDDCARAHRCQIKECPHKNEFLDQRHKSQPQSVAAGTGSGVAKFATGGDRSNTDTRHGIKNNDYRDTSRTHRIYYSLVIV